MVLYPLQHISNDEDYALSRGGTGKGILPKSWVSFIFFHHSASDGEKAYFHDIYIFFSLPVYLSVSPLDSQSKSIAGHTQSF